MEAPEYFIGGYYGARAGECLPEKRGSDQKNSDHFRVDDLLDFPNEEDVIMSDGFFDNVSKNSINGNDSSTFTSNDSCNSSGSAAGNVGYQSFADSQFTSELCVPYDELAELEWLSNFVEDSFSTDQNLQSTLHMLSGSKPATPDESSSEAHQESVARNLNNPIFHSETPLPAKARSKRSRVAPGHWSTRLLHLPPTAQSNSKKQENPNSKMGSGLDAPVRKCLHCAAEKTPQWRTGPMGPKTLCNACGVRFKSGRLVPEYRPAASPTFTSTKHSNSHRKVLELRRQKEMHRAQQEQFLNQTSLFGVSNSGDDFLIHHHNFRHMI